MEPPPAGDEFAEFISRVRAGDERAAEELVRRCEPEIRLEVRAWLRFRDLRLRRVFDSTDICQSVLARFFVGAAVGDYDLDEPSQLIRLLVGMARNRLSEAVKHHHRHRRDLRRVGADEADGEIASRKEETPSKQISHRELLQLFRQRLSEEERGLADLRAQGLDWEAVAGALGGTAEARPKQLTRSADRTSAPILSDELPDFLIVLSEAKYCSQQ